MLFTSHAALPLILEWHRFIYTLYQQAGLPWVYGGEYHEFHQLVKAVAQAWLKVGLKVHFVFDGSSFDDRTILPTAF